MKIKLDHYSHIPLYVQIESQLRQEILKPEYKEGKMLPNEVDFAKQIGVSLSTLRQAIGKLVYDGLLIRKKGIGTIVADKTITSSADNWLSFSQEMKMMGIEVKNYDLNVSWVYPDEHICNFFHIKNNVKILKLERLRGNIKNPFVYFISYFNPRIRLTGEEDFSKMLYDILKEYNVIAKLSKEKISAMLANEFLAEKLQINEGDAILKRQRFVYDPGERSIEWNTGYYRADSFVYSVESERKI